MVAPSLLPLPPPSLPPSSAQRLASSEALSPVPNETAAAVCYFLLCNIPPARAGSSGTCIDGREREQGRGARGRTSSNERSEGTGSGAHSRQPQWDATAQRQHESHTDTEREQQEATSECAHLCDDADSAILFPLPSCTQPIVALTPSHSTYACRQLPLPPSPGALCTRRQLQPH